jgi:membrane protease subunit HflK
MPWDNQGGSGPWGGGNSGGPKGPWGQGPNRGGPTPPDLEDIIRKGQDSLKRFFGGGGGSFGAKGVALVVIIGALLWMATGLYTVARDEVGINMVFGRYVGKTEPGLNYNLPYPIGQVIKPKVTTINRTEVGYRGTGGRTITDRALREERLMLTGDENIVDIQFDVQWQVNPGRAQDFVFNLQNPEGTVKAVAESAMREVIGRRNIQTILTTDQASIANEVKAIIQQTLDSYGAGIMILVVQLQAVQPPEPVREAFFDVNAAQQDQNRVQNEARTYASRVVPEARGRASEILQAAEAYKERAVAEAKGQASRFNQVYEQYKKAPEVTRERLYLETMEKVLGGADKVILDPQNGTTAPLFPLGDLTGRRSTTQTGGK